MIFRNEAPFLREAIDSVLPIVDECVLVDSGSEDGSEQVIHAMAKLSPKIRYYLRPWPHDFSDQKNFAIDHATGEWVLFLDADERIFQPDHSKILTAIDTPDIMAFDLTIRNYTNDITEIGYQLSTDSSIASGFVPTHLHRLFRRHPQIRYQGIIHERIEPSLKALEAKTQALDAVIHHLGPLKEKHLGLQQKRLNFYEDLARKKVTSHPNDAQAYWELGVILQKQRRLPEASETFKKALDLSPHTAEFEIYYCLSLFQQSRWDLLRAYRARSPEASVFHWVARAQTDASAIEKLDAYRNHFLQVALFIFELSLNHNRLDRLTEDRSKANLLFGSTGLVEFLEGSVMRRQGNYSEALRLLKISQQKGCALAAQEMALMPAS
jgi:tetratricopeptide (TPR) repeat protein